jgi:hypothetical protein
MPADRVGAQEQYALFSLAGNVRVRAVSIHRESEKAYSRKASFRHTVLGNSEAGILSLEVSLLYTNVNKGFI